MISAWNYGGTSPVQEVPIEEDNANIVTNNENITPLLPKKALEINNNRDNEISSDFIADPRQFAESEMSSMFIEEFSDKSLLLLKPIDKSKEIEPLKPKKNLYEETGSMPFLKQCIICGTSEKVSATYDICHACHQFLYKYKINNTTINICKNNYNCTITPKTRKCRACRLKKAQLAGVDFSRFGVPTLSGNVENDKVSAPKRKILPNGKIDGRGRPTNQRLLQHKLVSTVNTVVSQFPPVANDNQLVLEGSTGIIKYGETNCEGLEPKIKEQKTYYTIRVCKICADTNKVSSTSLICHACHQFLYKCRDDSKWSIKCCKFERKCEVSVKSRKCRPCRLIKAKKAGVDLKKFGITEKLEYLEAIPEIKGNKFSLLSVQNGKEGLERKKEYEHVKPVYYHRDGKKFKIDGSKMSKVNLVMADGSTQVVSFTDSPGTEIANDADVITNLQSYFSTIVKPNKFNL